MSTRPLLNAAPDTETETQLRKSVESLHRTLGAVREELADTKRELVAATRVISKLRHQMAPWHEALNDLFRELDEFGEANEGRLDPQQPVPAERYAAWKARLAPSCGRVIDALLIQPMTHSQLQGYCKAHYNTVLGAVKTLLANGLIEKHGNTYRLKP